MRFMESGGLLPCLSNPLPVLIPNQINPVYAIPSCFFKVHFNIILPSIDGSSKRKFSFKLIQQTLWVFLLSLMSASCYVNFSLPNFISLIISEKEYKSRSFSQPCSKFVSLKPKDHPQCPILNVRGQVSLTHTSTDKISVMNIL